MILRRQEDPLGAVLPYPWDEPVSVDGVPFAVAADGHQITVGLIERNLLLGGSPGSGKSGGGTALLCGISRLPHAAIIGIDPKRVELAPWRPRMSYVATQEADVSRVLGAIVEEMERRYEFLEETQKKKITPDMLSDELPLLVVVVDELADIVSIGVTKEELEGDKIRATRIRRLIAKGRAAAISVIALTQKPQADVVPSALRDLIQLRVSYATTTPAMTDTILGAGASQNGGLAHEIPASLKGVCYVIDETDRNPSRGRTFWVPDEDVAGLAEQVKDLRIALPWLTADEPPYSEEDGERPVRRTPQPRPTPVPSEIEVSLGDLDAFADPEPVPADDLWS